MQVWYNFFPAFTEFAAISPRNPKCFANMGWLFAFFDVRPHIAMLYCSLRTASMGRIFDICFAGPCAASKTVTKESTAAMSAAAGEKETSIRLPNTSLAMLE